MSRGPSLRLQAASHAAGRLLEDRGLSRLPIDPFLIAQEEGIRVEPLPPTTRGVSGALLCVNNDFTIAYATHVASEGFRRFSVAHELGHYFLPDHPQHFFGPGRERHESHAGFSSKDPYELEADHFAAGLLLPQRLTRPVIRSAAAGMAAVDALASACNSSLTAAAIHYARETEDAAAVVVSQGKQVLYGFVSRPLQDLLEGRWLRKGSLLPPRSATHAFNLDPQKVAESKRVEETTDLCRWFDDAPSHEMSEDVVGLGDYGKTLTVLFSENPLPDAEDDDDIE